MTITTQLQTAKEEQGLMTVDHRTISVNGINLHIAQAGPPEGSLALLLHGFPEFWYGWRAQIPALTEAGYRLWIPDQRGYNRSDKPDRIADYAVDALARDAIGLIDAAERNRVVLIGHDWGAAVAWQVAMRAPERLKALVILNVPHPDVMQQHLRRSLDQLRRSAYIGFFQLLWLPERLLRSRNWAVLARAMQSSSLPDTFSAAEMDRYRKAWSQPGALTAMLNWYRAAARVPTPPVKSKEIQVPTLVLWGARDRFLSREMARPSAEWCARGELTMLEDATHWLHHEKSERVNARIQEFLNAYPSLV
jgi:pimeloyl-ACP methyl ester carboxylesterase